MNETEEYRQSVADLLAATIREVGAREELSEACATETREPMSSAMTQQKRQAVYAATEDREEAAERFVIRWRRWGISLPDREQVAAS